MASRRPVTNKLRTAYRRATKRDKARILDEVMATTGMGQSTARRMLTGPVLPDPFEQVDKRKLRPKEYSDESRQLLEHVWALMGSPHKKYLVVKRGVWLPLLVKAGDLDKPFATPQTIAELEVNECREHRPVSGLRTEVDAATGYHDHETIAVAA